MKVSLAVVAAVCGLGCLPSSSSARVPCQVKPDAPYRGAPPQYHGPYKIVMLTGSVSCSKRVDIRVYGYEIMTLASGKPVKQSVGGGGGLPKGKLTDDFGTGFDCRFYKDIGSPGDRPVSMAFQMTIRAAKRPRKLLKQKTSEPVSFASLCPDLAAGWTQEAGRTS